MRCRHYYRMMGNGVLVCEKCGKGKVRDSRRRRRRTGRRRRRGARMRGAAVAGVLVAVCALVVLAVPGALDALLGLFHTGDPLASLPDGPPAPFEFAPDSGSDAPSTPGADTGPGADTDPGPRSIVDPWSDLIRFAPPLASEWDMSASPGASEAQLIEFSGRGARPDTLKQVLTLDSPTKLSFSFDNQSRVYHHFLLDSWYDDRGLAELDKNYTAEGPRGPPPLVDGASPVQPPGGKIKHVRDDAPPRDSEEVESLAGGVYGRHESLDALYGKALDAINGHRTAMGREPVQLSDNTAAQIHAQDVLERLSLSHYMSNGDKPYMTYSMTGGEGSVAQNAAFVGYDRPEQCGGFVLCTKIDPASDMLGQHDGMMFDDAHANWGHRDNILDPHHTHVSIGVAYTEYTLAFVQNFEARHIEGGGAAGAAANPISLDGSGRIKVAGRMDAGLDVHSIAVHYDPLPSTRTYRTHVNDMSYGLGEAIAYIFEPHPRGYVSTGETILVADRWSVSGGSVLVEFGAPAAMAESGAYTFYVWLTDGARAPFVGSARTFMVGDPAGSGMAG